MTDYGNVHTAQKRDFPHPRYAVNHCAGHTWHVVNCIIAAVTWSDLWTNYCHSAFFIPQFRILPIAAIERVLPDNSTMLVW